MNKAEAYKILDLTPSASEEEVKKAFKKKAKQFHPDINKEPGSEEQFKKINQAVQTIEKGEETQQGFPGGGGSWGFNIQDLFNGFRGNSGPQRKRIIAPDITIEQTLSFKESVLGCLRELSYSSNARCNKCEGSGEMTVDNGCSICHGVGKVRRQQGNMILESACQCKVSRISCSQCKSEGFINITSKISVKIPPGAIEGSAIDLGSRGNYIGEVFGQEQYSRLILRLHITKQSNLSLRDEDVFSTISLSLLEALKGCSKNIDTIDGETEVIIPSLSKNKDEILLPKLGLGREHNQVVQINISYPEKIEELISMLEKE